MDYLSKKSFWYGFVLVVLLCVGYFLFLSAPLASTPGMIMTVEEGNNLRMLSATLKQENIIRSRAAFEIFVILYGGEKHLVPGDYLLDHAVPVFTIAHRISTGSHRLPPVKVTIPEGFTNTDISQAFAAKLTDFNQTNFLNEAKDKQGYLFPDTYFFLITGTEDDAIKLMSENYEKKVGPLRPAIAALGKTENEIITMASIIEGEAKGDSDRGVISGILWKRIANGMPLEVDTAPVTYKVKGLPDAPVSNPGLQAIQAAMYPVASPYLYYLHDSSGTIHYARTFAEHKANIAKYLK